MPKVRTIAVTSVIAAAGLLAGCSSSSSTASSTTTSAPVTSTPSVAIGTIPAADLSPVGTQGKLPTVVVPTSPPPTTLQVATLIPGSGPKVKDGDSVTVNYTLATYSAGKVIQSSYTDGSGPFVVQHVGAGEVIPGWDAGLVGMQAGERKEFIIPASLGYGSNSPGAGIAANDTLVFIVDLIKIN